MNDTSTESLFDYLRASNAVAWRDYCEHPFVTELATGQLPEARFRYYLVQDYLFLVHFARAYGLAAYKAETLDDIRAAAAGLNAMVAEEMALHVTYCAGWGLTETQMQEAEEGDATMAYTRYVLEKGLSGDLLDLQVALAPCVVGYAEVGLGLIKAKSTVLENNPYRSWIEMYASDDYQSVAEAHKRQLDELMARRGGPGRLHSLKTIFRQATRLETAFWEMGLNPPQ